MDVGGATGASGRLATLDGLRGIAVLLVVLYHYFGGWTFVDTTLLYPYGDRFAQWPLVRDGQVGVNLFFLISGFVIFESLRRARGPLEFAAKRADRLVLPMLVLATLSFVVLTLLPTPFLAVRPVDLLVSWSFSAPEFWRWLDPEASYVDPAYWTLFVEVRFYILMALIWFVLGRSEARSIAAIAALALAAVVGEGLLLGAGMAEGAAALNLVLFPAPLSLFACGVLYARLFRGVASPWERAALVVLVLVGTLRLIGTPDDPGAFFNLLGWLTLFHLAFVLLALRPRSVGWLAVRPLVGLGRISYSLYLVHQGIGLALISRLPRDWPLWAQLAGVLIVTALMLGIAALSWYSIEQRRPFTTLLRRTSRAVPDVARQAEV